jgi:hypothetical protein
MTECERPWGTSSAQAGTLWSRGLGIGIFAAGPASCDDGCVADGVPLQRVVGGDRHPDPGAHGRPRQHSEGCCSGSLWGPPF